MADLIMLLESDVLVRAPLARYLRQCGYEVLEAARPDEAREIVSNWKHKIRAALIDFDADDNQGFLLVSWIRKSDPSIKIITAGTGATAAQKAGDLCHQGPAVRKPYNHQLVLNEIRRLTAARERAEGWTIWVSSLGHRLGRG